MTKNEFNFNLGDLVVEKNYSSFGCAKEFPEPVVFKVRSRLQKQWKDNGVVRTWYYIESVEDRGGIEEKMEEDLEKYNV